jgi:PadR family transcriptional regulator PadR
VNRGTRFLALYHNVCYNCYYYNFARRSWAFVLFLLRERQRALAPDDHKIDVRPKNWLTPVALVVLREQPSFGYELMERLEEFGFEQINPGTLYETLRQMEKEGLCKSEWETSTSEPARRMYSITNDGEAYLTTWTEECKKYQLVLDSFYLAFSCR